jgi:hypothetical protein
MKRHQKLPLGNPNVYSKNRLRICDFPKKKKF